MNTPSSHSLASGTDHPETGATAVAADEALHPDPITGEPGAHPTAVGVGALGAGAAGAALGAIAGPVGAIIGAAVGAIAGGLTGHEVAVTKEEEATAAVSTTSALPPGAGFNADLSDEPASFAAATGASAGEVSDREYALGDDEDDRLGAGNPAADERSMLSLGADRDETVRTAAYYHYEHRQASGRHGDEISDWVEAEQELNRS